MKNELTFRESIEYHLTLQYLNLLISNQNGWTRGRNEAPTYSLATPVHYLTLKAEYHPVNTQTPWKPLPAIPSYQLDTVTKDALNTIVNNILSELINYHHYDRGDLIKKIKDYIDESIIRIDDVPWIDERNYRQCLFTWYKFSKVEFSSYNGGVSSPFLYNNLTTYNSNRVYSTFNQNTNRPLKNQTIKSIIDTISLVKTSKNEKLKLLSQINNDFKSAERIESFSFLENTINEDWATRYLDNIFKNDNLYELDFNIHNHLTGPYLDKDIVILNFDITSRETIRGKKEIIKSLKKAWQQKLHRQNLQKKNRKAYNFTLSKDIQQKLDFIKESWEERERGNGQRFDPLCVTKNEIVEILINREFSNLNSKTNFR